MMEDGIEDFIVPPPDKYGQSLEIDATAARLDFFKGLLQRSKTTSGVPYREVP